jgi:hypothetical protein
MIDLLHLRIHLKMRRIPCTPSGKGARMTAQVVNQVEKVYLLARSPLSF